MRSVDGSLRRTLRTLDILMMKIGQLKRIDAATWERACIAKAGCIYGRLIGNLGLR
jgi:hypothetical protein